VAPAVQDRTGVLVLRVWVEVHPEKGLRARITETNDIVAGRQRSVAAASVAGVVEIVRAWLERFERGGDAEMTES
jgi:hypothetical protein